MTKKLQTSRTSDAAVHLLHRAGQCADELFAQHVGEAQLTPRQFIVLQSVAMSSEPSQTGLVDITGMDRSTRADIVRRLVERGFLQRRRTRADARMYAVRLTPAGQAALATASPAVDATEDRIMEAVPADCRAAFLKGLASIVTTLGPISSARVSARAAAIVRSAKEKAEKLKVE